MRKKLGFSQEELAERANLHRTYVSDVERGARNISLESIERLAQALQVSIGSLFHAAASDAGAFPKAEGDGASSLVEVLLVEDNLNDVELTLHAFKKARFTNRVHVVRDGAEALDYLFPTTPSGESLTRRPPQVVLLDLNLPKVSGLDVLRRIRENAQTCNIEVVVLTVSEDAADVAECRRLGAKSYIVKPVNFQKLSQATPDLELNWALLGKPASMSPRRTT